MSSPEGQHGGSDIPLHFRCPITDEVMVDPVMLAESGETYERNNILAWLSQGHRTDPASGMTLYEEPNLVSNHTISDAIKRFRYGSDTSSPSGEPPVSSPISPTAKPPAPAPKPPAPVPTPQPPAAARPRPSTHSQLREIRQRLAGGALDGSVRALVDFRMLVESTPDVARAAATSGLLQVVVQLLDSKDQLTRVLALKALDIVAGIGTSEVCMGVAAAGVVPALEKLLLPLVDSPKEMDMAAQAIDLLVQLAQHEHLCEDIVYHGVMQPLMALLGRPVKAEVLIKLCSLLELLVAEEGCADFLVTRFGLISRIAPLLEGQESVRGGAVKVVRAVGVYPSINTKVLSVGKYPLDTLAMLASDKHLIPHVLENLLPLTFDYTPQPEPDLTVANSQSLSQSSSIDSTPLSDGPPTPTQVSPAPKQPPSRSERSRSPPQLPPVPENSDHPPPMAAYAQSRDLDPAVRSIFTTSSHPGRFTRPQELQSGSAVQWTGSASDGDIPASYAAPGIANSAAPFLKSPSFNDYLQPAADQPGRPDPIPLVSFGSLQIASSSLERSTSVPGSPAEPGPAARLAAANNTVPDEPTGQPAPPRLNRSNTGTSSVSAWSGSSVASFAVPGRTDPQSQPIMNRFLKSQDSLSGSQALPPADGCLFSPPPNAYGASPHAEKTTGPATGPTSAAPTHVPTDSSMGTPGSSMGLASATTGPGGPLLGRSGFGTGTDGSVVDDVGSGTQATALVSYSAPQSERSMENMDNPVSSSPPPRPRSPAPLPHSPPLYPVQVVQKRGLKGWFGKRATQSFANQSLHSPPETNPSYAHPPQGNPPSAKFSNANAYDSGDAFSPMSQHNSQGAFLNRIISGARHMELDNRGIAAPPRPAPHQQQRHGHSPNLSTDSMGYTPLSTGDSAGSGQSGGQSVYQAQGTGQYRQQGTGGYRVQDTGGSVSSRKSSVLKALKSMVVFDPDTM